MNQISAAVPAEIAERMADVGFTSAEEYQLERLTNALIDEKLASRTDFDELAFGIESSEILHPLHRALQSLDQAIKGKDYAIDAVFQALSQIQKTVSAEAHMVWGEDCSAQAELDLFGGDE
jgi:hypothetical protein